MKGRTRTIKLGKYSFNIPEKYTNSIIFWNVMIYVTTIIGYCINWEITCLITAGLGSLIFLVVMLDGVEQDLDLWYPLTFLFWILAVLVGIGFLFFGIYYITIRPFNEWLDNTKTTNY